MKHYFKILFFVLASLISMCSFSQEASFEISIEPMEIDELGGLQSFAVGQYEGKWLLVGGRLDGLHRRQPWAAFDLAGHNNQLIVVDPISEQKWSAPLTSLSIAIQEQLSSTNMQFFQEGDYLYFLGGYGYSATENDHTTFSNLTAINVPDVIEAVVNETDISSFFRQIEDSEFQVTGGKLKRINDTYHLLGGQKFIGRYNPMGPDFGPGFIQEYTNAIRKFNLTDDGVDITINHLPSFEDEENLHRRDYNGESQILPNGEEGITMFSGVFQPVLDLPFLNSVTVDTGGYTVDNTFEQYYNHYHCPVIPLYSESNNEMHTVFFGGIAQFYEINGVLWQDDNVPFVKTIARVTRDSDGTMAEYKLPIEMPALLGAGAEFIPNMDLAYYNNRVLKLDNISADSVLVGYIFGGINSTEENIFFINEGTQSVANNQLFKVYLKNTGSVMSVDQLNVSSTRSLNMMAYPNPNEGELNISFNLTQKGDVAITIRDAKGALIENAILENRKSGENIYRKNISGLAKGSVYFITIKTNEEEVTRKLVVAD